MVLATSNRVVYSPHEYPASVYGQSWFSAPNYPANLPSVWDANWGYLARTGSAPIFVGEFGTKLETTSDAQWLRALVSYLGTNGLSFGYWSFNPNSGDTGELVADDWKTTQTAKLAALAPLLAGMRVRHPDAIADRVRHPDTVAHAYVVAHAYAVAHAQDVAHAHAYVVAHAHVAHAHVPSVPGLRTGFRHLDAAERVAGRLCGGVLRQRFARSPAWTISWSSPGATQVVNAWGMSCTVASGSIACTGKDWAYALAAGQERARRPAGRRGFRAGESAPDGGGEETRVR